MSDLSDQLLRQVVDELKGLRSETNQRFEILTNRVDGLNDRVDGLNKRVDGLHASLVVLQQ